MGPKGVTRRTKVPEFSLSVLAQSRLARLLKQKLPAKYNFAIRSESGAGRRSGSAQSNATRRPFAASAPRSGRSGTLPRAPRGFRDAHVGGTEAEAFYH